MRRLPSIALVVLVSLLGFACDTNDNTLTTGVEGRILAGSTCPGPISEGQVCTIPVMGEFTVTNVSGTFVVTFMTDDQGRFRLPLEPGAYTITLDESDLGITDQHQDVVVTATGFSEVTLIFDTGIL